MNLLALYLADLNHLTRRERIRAAWYAAIILIPLAPVILAHLWYGPGLDRVMGW
ncbi:MAG: hypothetical protein WC749_01970 [Dehalococcoidia bacterium]